MYINVTQMHIFMYILFKLQIHILYIHMKQHAYTCENSKLYKPPYTHTYTPPGGDSVTRLH